MAGKLVVPRGDAAVLLAAPDQPFDHVAATVQRPVERPVSRLTRSPRQRVPAAPPAQDPTAPA